MRRIGAETKQSAKQKRFYSNDKIIRIGHIYTKVSSEAKRLNMLSGGPSVAAITPQEKLTLFRLFPHSNIFSHLPDHSRLSGREVWKEERNSSKDLQRKRLIPKEILIKKYGKENIKRFAKFGRSLTSLQRINLNTESLYFPTRKFKKSKHWKVGYLEFIGGGKGALTAMKLRHFFNTAYGEKLGKEKMIQHNIINNKVKAENFLKQALETKQVDSHKDPDTHLKITQLKREAIHRYFQSYGLPGGLREAKAIYEFNKSQSKGLNTNYDEADFLNSRYHGMMSDAWQHRTEVEKNRGGKYRYTIEPHHARSLPSKIRIESIFTKPLVDRISTYFPYRNSDKSILFNKNPGSYKARQNRRVKKIIAKVSNSIQKSSNTFNNLPKSWNKYLDQINYSDIDAYLYNNR